MTTTTSPHITFDPAPDGDLLDVLIVGAGLSGIGAAHFLQQRCPGKRFAILESRQAIGGTWDLFRYPGIRSDSDMYTLGYAFKPWTNPKAIADGPSIRRYVQQTAEEAGIVRHIRFGQQAVSASWSSRDACWTIRARRTGTMEEQVIRARFLYLCSGYYSYDEAYRPEFEGEADYQGRIVQPQFWPEDLDHAGKRVVVIGSGATAVTIVPSMAQTAAHVTMLQRSPSYVLSRPSQDKIANFLLRHLPARLAYAISRWKNVLVAMFFYRLSRRRPDQVKQYILKLAGQELGSGYDVHTHFSPRYKPWDQRVCFVPDSDLFQAVREGRASVVTDGIARFTPAGILLNSGKEIPADIVVMATGLKLQLMGGMTLQVDGQPFQPAEAMAYKGMMLSDLPNCAMAFGYTNASWTLKADLTAAYVCRLLNYMDRHRKTIAVPRRDEQVRPQPFLSFTSGYVQRAKDVLPQQGERRPWQVYQNYFQDLMTIRYGRIDDGVMRFGTREALP
ncbi:flavin-containing monooxygenase [Noviherbaspirillum galbum]|uniref:NAD(P)/FAD-dependent oxidoreductase n=1 Tax=Noviherbaspirillum galbum TaxID=2709383 RepID=A0A6B3SNI4_9BURK|nr:NAD(P)/FAD-dependent oxidoreductase [Noviherbaspirillum galbum]NEX60002.1 NAD(P)/FAD-dependent oxidoreductase [Noviherbaspirillum galbum]